MGPLNCASILEMAISAKPAENTLLTLEREAGLP